MPPASLNVEGTDIDGLDSWRRAKNALRNSGRRFLQSNQIRVSSGVAHSPAARSEGHHRAESWYMHPNTHPSHLLPLSFRSAARAGTPAAAAPSGVLSRCGDCVAPSRPGRVGDGGGTVRGGCRRSPESSDRQYHPSRPDRRPSPQAANLLITLLAPG